MGWVNTWTAAAVLAERHLAEARAALQRHRASSKGVLAPMDQESRLLDMQARLCHALSSPKRLQILYLLEQGELSAGELARAVGVSTPNLSQHLALMREQGLVEARRDGSNTYYRLSMPEILEACAAVRGVLLKRLQTYNALLGGAETGS